MQYGISIIRRYYLLSVLLMTVWLTGCVQEELGSTPSPAGNGIRFTLTVPDVNLPSVSSRTMTGTGTAKKEDEIETVDILVFDMSKTPAVYLEWVSATGVTQDLADNSTVSFSAVLSPTTASTCIFSIASTLVVVPFMKPDTILSSSLFATTTMQVDAVVGESTAEKLTVELSAKS